MIKLTKDHVGGALLVVTGLAVAVAATGYGIGTLQQPGSGFFPGVLGVLLALVGAALLASTRRARDGGAVEAPAEMAHLAGPVVQWRGWLCIVGGALAFAALGEHGGLVPASFASVFIAAMGDRGNTWRSAAALAALMTALAVVVFHFGLHMLLPLFTW